MFTPWTGKRHRLEGHGGSWPKMDPSQTITYLTTSQIAVPLLVPPGTHSQAGQSGKQISQRWSLLEKPICQS